MSGRTDTVKATRAKFWVVLALAGFLLGIGFTDMGGEAVGYGLLLIQVGWEMGERYRRLSSAMDAEERG